MAPDLHPDLVATWRKRHAAVFEIALRAHGHDLPRQPRRPGLYYKRRSTFAAKDRLLIRNAALQRAISINPRGEWLMMPYRAGRNASYASHNGYREFWPLVTRAANSARNTPCEHSEILPKRTREHGRRLAEALSFKQIRRLYMACV